MRTRTAPSRSRLGNGRWLSRARKEAVRGLTLSLAFIAGAAFAQEYFPPPDAQGGWRTLKDSAEIRKTAGMDLQKLDWALDYASRSSQHGGLLVARHGYLIYEKYYGKGNREA